MEAAIGLLLLINPMNGETQALVSPYESMEHCMADLDDAANKAIDNGWVVAYDCTAAKDFITKPSKATI